MLRIRPVAVALAAALTGLLPAGVVARQVGLPPTAPAAPAPAQAGQSRDVTGQPGVQPPEQRGSILGTVFDATSGQPLEGVRLTASGSAVRGGASAISDADGRFAFVGLGAGEVMLRAAKSGWVSMTYGQVSASAGRTGTPIELAAGQSIKDLKFSLPKGGVITGIVFDEKNRPSIGTPVRVLRWSMATGERTLVAVNSVTTDDRGVYRAYGLAPGDYVINAVPRNQVGSSMVDQAMVLEALERAEALQARVEALSAVSGSFTPATATVSVDGQTFELNVGSRNEPPPTFEGYAPIYYPGTPALGSAATVSIGLSEERGGVDFALARVTMARVSGMVALPPGLNVTNVQLRLVDKADRVPGVNMPTARSNRDGRFTFTAVPPGQYQLVASATVRPSQVTTPRPAGAGANFAIETVLQGPNSPQMRLWGLTDVTVAGAPLENVSVVMQPGVSVSGRLDFQGAAARPAPNARIRLTLGAIGVMASAMGSSSVTATVGQDGRFTFEGVVPGQYRVRSLSGAQGWTLGTAMAGGIDTLDFPFQVQPGQPTPELLVTATDRTAALNGTIQDAMGRPTADYTVIIFPSDERYWLPQARRIRSTRPSTGGKFDFTGLPSGDYRLAAVTDVEAGQWYDPAFLEQLVAASVMVSLGDGQTRTQDLRVGR
jgi:protocatechuate 3,4-dioxygenase beta subunit